MKSQELFYTREGFEKKSDVGVGIVGGGGGILVWMLAEILLVELLRSVLIRWKINPETSSSSSNSSNNSRG